MFVDIMIFVYFMFVKCLNAINAFYKFDVENSLFKAHTNTTCEHTLLHCLL